MAGVATNNHKKNGKKRIYKVKVNFSWKNIFLYGFLLVFLLFLFAGLSQNGPTQKTVALSQIIQDVKAGKVTQITVTDTQITATEKNKQTVQASKEASASIYTMFRDAGVPLNATKVTVKDDSGLINWVSILSNILPIVLMVAFFYFIFRQARGAQENIFSFGKSSAKLFNKDNPKVTFNDVAGVDEAKQELTEVVDFLKHPDKYKALGARAPKGVLMVGPAGTGKTLLARATAGEAGTSFFSMAGSEFMEMLVGVGASRVRDLFLTAKKNQPAIIFIDEVDAIGRQRGNGLMGGHDEREQTLNQILVEMDGFTQNESVVVIAATNRPDVLDPALIRPGRFDRKVTLDMPDVEGRKAILKIHSKGKPFAQDAQGKPLMDWEKVAKRTVGFSGADLENMLNEAAIQAAVKNKKVIEMRDVEESATKVKLGPEKKRLQSDEDRKITAYHEGGHAVVSWYMPHMDAVHRVSIVSRGMSLGHTMMEPSERSHETRTFIMEQVAVMMGGRAAENFVFGEMTTGASNDIEKATEVARAMVVEWGMSDLGAINLQTEKSYMFERQDISPDMQAKIDTEIKKILDEGYAQAVKVLQSNKKQLDLLANTLLKKETMEADEFAIFMGSKPKVKSPFLPITQEKAKRQIKAVK